MQGLRAAIKEQLYPGLCQKNCGQHVKAGDSAPLLCSGETPPGVLCPALEPSTEDGCGPVGVGPEERHKSDQKTGTPLLLGKAEKDCSAWRRDGFRKTLLRHFST